MERGKRWELAQRESNKKDETKLTPLPVDPRELYCNVTPVMFARFVCALGFRIVRMIEMPHFHHHT